MDSEITTREAQATQQHHRIVLAQHLGEVFEKAYERVATHKTAGSNNHPETYGVWPDFFYRVLKAADVKGASDNLGDVLRAARRLRKLEGVLVPLGLLPE